jgi:hypothetical protein
VAIGIVIEIDTKRYQNGLPEQGIILVPTDCQELSNMPQLTERICEVVSTDWHELFKMPQLTEENGPIVSTDWHELFKMPQLTEENWSNCLN